VRGRSTVGFARFTDGTANTLLAAEVIQGQGADLRGFSWYGPSSAFTSYLAPNSKDADVLEDPSYCVYPYAANPPCVNTLTPGALPAMSAARSRHSGGVSVGLGDGSVRFIKNSVAVPVWRGLSTTQGSEVISGDAY
jgi:prepilin-type processing-associated H-X9-DG protein